MKRRNFIIFCGGIAASPLAVSNMWHDSASAHVRSTTRIKSILIEKPGLIEPALQQPLAKKKSPVHFLNSQVDEIIVDNIAPSPAQNSPQPPAEKVLVGNQKDTFEKVLARLVRLQKYVGYGNFNIIGWDQSLRMARNHQAVGAFTRVELDFIEEIFSIDADSLGFYGDKVVTSLTATISKNDIRKIPATGHFLFKGESTNIYRKIRKDIGDSIILTSGIRGVVKQIYLFLNKTSKVGGNLSLASYSLAPPGHSYHAIGDFDVGKRNFGARNFTEAFANTDEFRRLSDLGYLDIRYPQNNPYGVRYEPWHIKII
jgi:hypothetical protein